MPNSTYRQGLVKARQQRPYRGTSTQQGYGADHRRWRAVILARDPVCRRCHRQPATQADHITPIRAGGARLDPANGQGLCHSCHSRITAGENR